jgi:N-acyl homoserine lactone hydrolase
VESPRLEIVRLHLAHLTVSGMEWPVHGFVILHPRAGAILVDTGVGGPERWLTDWRVVNRSIADALAEHDLSPVDIRIVVNTHLHFDHCGQNGVFKHAPFHVQRAELDRARRESAELTDWFDFAGARFELLDGDAEIAEGVRTVATPGHTVGHQSVVVAGPGGEDLMIGDAAYTIGLYRHPDRAELPEGQADDREAWERSLRHLHEMSPARVHFCHDTRVVEHS